MILLERPAVLDGKIAGKNAGVVSQVGSFEGLINGQPGQTHSTPIFSTIFNIEDIIRVPLNLHLSRYFKFVLLTYNIDDFLLLSWKILYFINLLRIGTFEFSIRNYIAGLQFGDVVVKKPFSSTNFSFLEQRQETREISPHWYSDLLPTTFTPQDFFSFDIFFNMFF